MAANSLRRGRAGSAMLPRFGVSDCYGSANQGSMLPLSFANDGVGWLHLETSTSRPRACSSARSCRAAHVAGDGASLRRWAEVRRRDEGGVVGDDGEVVVRMAMASSSGWRWRRRARDGVGPFVEV